MSITTEAPNKMNGEKKISQDEEKNIDPEINKTRSTLAQVVATLGFCMILIGLGFIFLMPTIVIGELLNSKEGLSLDDESASWFGSIIFISQPLGSLLSGFIQDAFGRKRCMMLANIPEFIGWILLYYSSNTFELYAAAVIMGLSVGFMEAPLLSYLGEITEPRLRGPLTLFAASFGGIGVLIECLIGALTDWRSVCAISSGVPVIAFITTLLIPESPTWLANAGKIQEAERALCWLRGWVHPVYVRKEFLALLEHTKTPNIHEIARLPLADNKENREENEQGQINKKSLSVIDTFKLLAQPKLYRPLMLILIFFFISLTVSLLGMRPFLVKIFSDMGMPLGPHWVLLITSGLQLIAGTICMCVMSTMGKRLITLISLSVSTISCILLGVFLLLPDKFPWIIFTIFCVIFFASGFGVIFIPWVLLAEVFPLEGRGLACGLSAAVCYIFGFVVTKFYINISTWFGIHGACFIYGAFGVFGFIYLYYQMPETEGKTLEEIEEFFKNEDDKRKEKS